MHIDVDDGTVAKLVERVGEIEFSAETKMSLVRYGLVFHSLNLFAHEMECVLKIQLTLDAMFVRHTLAEIFA